MKTSIKTGTLIVTTLLFAAFSIIPMSAGQSYLEPEATTGAYSFTLNMQMDLTSTSESSKEGMYSMRDYEATNNQGNQKRFVFSNLYFEDVMAPSTTCFPVLVSGYDDGMITYSSAISLDNNYSPTPFYLKTITVTFTNPVAGSGALWINHAHASGSSTIQNIVSDTIYTFPNVNTYYFSVFMAGMYSPGSAMYSISSIVVTYDC